MEAHVIAAPVVRVGGTRGLMRGDLLGDFQTTAIPQVCGNSCRPERVTPDFGFDAGILGPPPDHGEADLQEAEPFRADFDRIRFSRVVFDIDQWISTVGYAIVVFDSSDYNVAVFD